MVPIRDAQGVVVGFGGRLLPTACTAACTSASTSSSSANSNITTNNSSVMIVPAKHSKKVAKYVNSPNTCGKQNENIGDKR